MVTYIWPPQSVSVSVPPVEFLLNGVETTVSRDTATPANSRPFPVINLDSNGDVATPLTNAQLRASPVPVSGPLTDTELRASAVPVSALSLPLPSGAATEAKQDTGNTSLSSIDGRLTTLNAKDFATSAKQDTGNTSLSSIDGKFTTLNAKDFATSAKQDTGNTSLSSIDGKFTTLNAKDFATSAKQDAEAVLVGAVNETAPASDTDSSGLNGRLQRIAQRITSLIALLPGSLGQKTMANSFAVTVASDQSALSVTQTALAGSYQEITNLTTSVQTFTAPAGSKWFMIQADDTNVANIRFKVGAAATTTSGIQLQPARSEDCPVGGNISVIAESGTNQKVYVQFGA